VLAISAAASLHSPHLFLFLFFHAYSYRASFRIFFLHSFSSRTSFFENQSVINIEMSKKIGEMAISNRNENNLAAKRSGVISRQQRHRLHAGASS